MTTASDASPFVSAVAPRLESELDRLVDGVLMARTLELLGADNAGAEDVQTYVDG